MDDQEKITYFAETDFRNRRAKFGIKAKDRTRHVYVIGKTGMGKSTLLENMAAQDILNGEGLAVIDPHGSMAEKLLEYVPEHRIKDVVYFAPFDTDYPISFNVLEDVGIDKRHLVASGLMSSFKKIWVDAWSARMEYILNNILLALLEFPGSTLLGVNRMLADKDFRKLVVDNIKDPSVHSFWVDEFAKYGDRYMQEAGAAIQNKIGQFTSNPLIRNIIGQPESSFDIRKVMDEKKIVIINLSKGRIGEQNANLLGGMLITKIYLGAMSRADKSPDEMNRLPNFYLYVDEFQSFASDSFADILSEARKYKLNLTIAHQYVEQMSEAVRAAVFGNVGTMIVFRVGSFDAEIFEKEFAPLFTAEDIVNLGMFQVYLRLMIDGIGSKPFSAVTMKPVPMPPRSFREDIILASREHNAKTREVVEAAINLWHDSFKPEKKERKPFEEGGEKKEWKPKTEFKDVARPSRPFTENRETPKREFPKPAHTNTPPPIRTPVRSQEAPVATEKPIVERKPYVEPVRPKESLRSLLGRLSIEPETPKKTETISTMPAISTKEPEQKIEHKQTEAPLSVLKTDLKKSRAPSEDKLNDLRALLAKVTKEQPKREPQETIPVAPVATGVATTIPQKEVPEEVLRSILSN